MVDFVGHPPLTLDASPLPTPRSCGGHLVSVPFALTQTLTLPVFLIGVSFLHLFLLGTFASCSSWLCFQSSLKNLCRMFFFLRHLAALHCVTLGQDAGWG